MMHEIKETSVVFRNSGEIDTRSITTFGVSSKESSGAIGYFGTGLKYAIAILLREKCQITIITGGKALTFGTQDHRVRVDDFTFVTMNEEPLAFTTELGKNWEPWQAIRELWCNAIDEQGNAVQAEAGSSVRCQDDETVVIISGNAVEKAWSVRDTILLSSEPIFKSGQLDIHQGKSSYIYYKGVRVHNLSKPSKYTYNLKGHVSLTEDRTMQHPGLAGWYAAKGIAQLSDRNIITEAVTASDRWMEHDLDFDGVSAGSDFSGIVKDLARQQVANLNRTATKCVNFDTNEILDDLPVMQLTKVDQARLDKAISFSKSIGFDVDSYPIVVCEHLGDSVLGRAANGKIYLSKIVFMQGTKMVAGTLIEEFIHLRHKLHDETRQMQNFLFDALVSVGEQLTGEPL